MLAAEFDVASGAGDADTNFAQNVMVALASSIREGHDIWTGQQFKAAGFEDSKGFKTEAGWWLVVWLPFFIFPY